MSKATLALSIPLIAAGAFISENAAEASSRRVLIENFTATWCTYCPSVSEAIINVMEDYPDQAMGLQVHGSDDYTCTWGNSRLNFYGVTGFPTVWIDGWWSQVGSYGSVSANYNNIVSGLNQALNRATDIVVSTSGEELSNSQYKMTYEIGVEAGGQSKTVRFYAIQCLNLYPASSTPRYFNCAIQHRTETTHTLSPGQTIEIEHTWNLSGASLANKDDVVYISMIQDVANSGPSQVHNADTHEHGQLPPSTVTVGAGGDFATITDAINSVGEYSTINIGPGTYEELLDLEGKNLTIRGTSGPEATIVDGTHSGIVLNMLSGEDDTTLIEGLTITNGQFSMASGVRCNSNPTIRNCVISNNNANAVVAGLMSSGKIGPTIEDVLFCNNSVGEDQDAHLWGYWTDAGNVVFQDDCEVAPCDGDFNGDTSVGVDDLLTVIAGWGNPYTVDDLLQVIANWGSDC